MAGEAVPRSKLRNPPLLLPLLFPLLLPLLPMLLRPPLPAPLGVVLF